MPNPKNTEADGDDTCAPPRHHGQHDLPMMPIAPHHKTHDAPTQAPKGGKRTY